MGRRTALWTAVPAVAAVLLALPARPLVAQDENRTLTSALQAYQNLEYETAAALFRRALAVEAPSPDTLPTALRPKALTYLAASDYYRGRKDSASVVFRRLIVQDPRYRPDPLIFPPEVTAAFENARRVMKVVAVVTPGDTSLRLGRDQYPIKMYASSFHEIVVGLEHPDGRFIKGIYAGPIGDSLDVSWDGFDSASVPADGNVVLTVTSRPTAGGEVVRVVRIMLDIHATHADTLPWPTPPDTLFLPEKAPPGAAVRSLSGGLLGAAAVLLLPSVVGSGTHATGSRYVVVGALSLAGIVGFASQRPGVPLPDNVAKNLARRAAFQRQIDLTKQDNARRRIGVLERIRAGTPLVISRDTQ